MTLKNSHFKFRNHMRPFIKGFLFSTILLLYFGALFSQTRSDLEKKRSTLLKDIELTNHLLSETKQNKDVSLNELEMLEKQIDNREALIRNIAAQINILEKTISEKGSIIIALEKDLASLKVEYGKMIYYTYKNQQAYNKLFFIFSSSSLNEAYNRLNYLKRYTTYRKKQAILIQRIKQTLSDKLNELSDQKNKKVNLLASQLKQKGKLDQEKTDKGTLIGKLRKQEKQLLTKLYNKRKAAEKLDKAIADIIKKELEAARKKSNKDKEAGIDLTPESAILSENFTNNKGKLPWPVERGIITHNFGERDHPVLKGVKIQNNGIDIKTTSNATVRAVFEGQVVEVFSNPSFHKAVMIKHGEFYTVYTNLKEVFVKKGDKIQIKQIIGLVYTDTEISKTEVHFELWKGFEKLNPAYWISGK